MKTTQDGSADLGSESLCITNIINYNFGTIISILCIYWIKILLNDFKTFQITFKSIFYSFIYIAIDNRMTRELYNNNNSVCGNDYQHPIWSDIGILYDLFDVFVTNIIDTFVQGIFGTIEMDFISFWCLIKNYVWYNKENNNSTNIKAKLCLKMSVVLSCLIGISIVYSGSATYAPYSSETDLIYTHFARILSKYFNDITTVTTGSSGVLSTTKL